MDNKYIIRMAREAGAEATHYQTWGDVYEFDMELLERFAALVAAHEREACAKVCEEEAASWAKLNAQDEEGYGAIQCAAAIRARSEK